MSIVVIDGLDGSGKSTQMQVLCESLGEAKKKYMRIKLPDYSSRSSSLVSMYLSGELGNDADDVNAYAAGSFYAVDRFANFRNVWKKAYEEGVLIIADRYTTSNIIYQMHKLKKEEWQSYIDWTEDFEYNKLCIPRPDKVIFLDMPIDVSQRLMLERYSGDESRKDIHERDVRFLEKCAEAAAFAAERLGWRVIGCAQNGVPRSIESIHKDIINEMEEFL